MTWPTANMAIGPASLTKAGSAMREFDALKTAGQRPLANNAARQFG